LLKALLATMTLLPITAAAQNWIVDEAASRIGFRFTQMGSPVEGQFDHFGSDIRFDPQALDDARVRTEIEVDSVNTGNEERDSGIRSQAWFDASNNPQGLFESIRFEDKGDDRYDVRGRLTLRGTTREIILPMTIRIDGRTARAEGSVTLDRQDFGIGQGDWASDKVVGYEVPVDIVIVAHRP